LHPTTDSPAFEGWQDFKRLLWLDQVVFQGVGPDRWAQSTFPAGQRFHFFTTDSLYTNCQEGPRFASLVRGCECRTMGSDGYSNCQFVVNSTINDINAGTSGAHPDVMDLDDPTHACQNYIFYGIRALNSDSQGFAFENTGTFTDNRDIAVVNCLILKNIIDPLQCSFFLPVNHLLVWNNTFADIQWDWRTNVLGGAQFTNVSVKGNVFYAKIADPVRITETQLTTMAVMDQNHYIRTNAVNSFFMTPGTNVTTLGTLGSLFQDSVMFRPQTGSPLVNRMAAPVTAADLYGQQRTSPTSVGAVRP
jgi:hypothetical protein